MTNAVNNNTNEANMSKPTYTADNLISLKVAAVNAVRSNLLSRLEWHTRGQAQGFLPDSSKDALRFPEMTGEFAPTIRASSILFDGLWTVMVRCENEFGFQDYTATPEFYSLSSWCADSFEINPDMGGCF